MENERLFRNEENKQITNALRGGLLNTLTSTQPEKQFFIEQPKTLSPALGTRKNKHLKEGLARKEFKMKKVIKE